MNNESRRTYFTHKENSHFVGVSGGRGGVTDILFHFK